MKRYIMIWFESYKLVLLVFHFNGVTVFVQLNSLNTVLVRRVIVDAIMNPGEARCSEKLHWNE